MKYALAFHADKPAAKNNTRYYCKGGILSKYLGDAYFTDTREEWSHMKRYRDSLVIGVIVEFTDKEIFKAKLERKCE